MASDAKDPRKAVLLERAKGSGGVTIFEDGFDSFLARLDAADPLRALLPQIMERLQREWKAVRGVAEDRLASDDDLTAALRSNPEEATDD